MTSLNLKKYTYITIPIIVGVLFFVLINYLQVNNTICIAKKGFDSYKFFDDTALFIASVDNTKQKAFDFLIRQFDEETGFFIYSTHTNGEVSTNNNAIRQLLASRVVATQSQNMARVESIHARNLEVIFSDWYVENEEYGYVLAYGKAKLGASALLLRTLVASPLYSQYEREANMLANGIVSLMEDDGSFNAWFEEPTYSYDEDRLLTFYSGEALLALIEYNAIRNDSVLSEHIGRSVDFYLKKYVTEIEQHYYPAYVPWYTQVFSTMYTMTGDIKYADAVFVINDRLLTTQDTTDFVGRFYNPNTPLYGTPHASSDAVYTEGLVYAYEVAHMVGDIPRATQYKTAIIYGYDNLRKLQFGPTWWNMFDSGATSQTLYGGLRTNICNNWIRIDATAHALDALAHIETVFNN